MFRSMSRLPTVSLTILAATLIAACGSNSSGPARSSARGQPSFAQMQRDVTDFARCMRSHGVPTFPDPTTSPRSLKMALNPAAQHSPAFASALSECRHLLPAGGAPTQTPAHTHAQVAAALAFARCIRAHGFPSFPDPSSDGSITHQMVARAGIDLHQPAVLRAGDACAPVTHGFITRASVAHFIAGH
jgi:hypothetical protein